MKVGAFVYGIQDSLVYYAVTAPFHYAAADVAEESIFIILASPPRVVTCVNRSGEPDMAPVTAPLSMAEVILVTCSPDSSTSTDSFIGRLPLPGRRLRVDLEEVRVALRGARYARERTLQHLPVLGGRSRRADHHRADYFS